MWSRRRGAGVSPGPTVRVVPEPPPRPNRPDPGAKADRGGSATLWTDGFGRAAIRSGQLILVAVALAAAVTVLVTLRLVVVPVVIAVMLAAAVWPLVSWMREHGVPKILAAWAALLTGGLILGGLITLVVLGIRSEWTELRDQAVEGLREFERRLDTGQLPIDADRLEQARQSLSESLAGAGVGARAAGGAVLFAEVAAGILLTIVVLFFLLKDGPAIWRFALRAVPAAQHDRAERLGVRCVDVLGGYVRGTTIVALVDAVLIGTALAILGVPLALPLAVVVFLGAYIPLLGATIAGMFAALVALVSEGPVTALIVVAIVIVVNQVEGDVLAPLVLGKALSLHPLAVLLALAAGTVVAGIVGALLAVPLVAVAWATVSSWNDNGSATATEH